MPKNTIKPLRPTKPTPARIADAANAAAQPPVDPKSKAVPAAFKVRGLNRGTKISV
jgi:hypothetical protein